MLKIAIDIDGTIDATTRSIEFFDLLTHCLEEKAKIYILTNRDPGIHSTNETKQELARLGIRFDYLIIKEDKASFILNEGIDIFFENQDEYFKELPDTVMVFKAREVMNFDFLAKKWSYSNKTGINIDKE